MSEHSSTNSPFSEFFYVSIRNSCMTLRKFPLQLLEQVQVTALLEMIFILNFRPINDIRDAHEYLYSRDVAEKFSSQKPIAFCQP